MSALRERHLGLGKAVPWPRQATALEDVVTTHPPQPYPTLAKVDTACFDTFPVTTGGGCGVGGLPQVDVVVGYFNKVVGALVEHSREGARLLGTIVDTPHQPLAPILATLPEGFDSLVARVVTRGMSPTTMRFLGEDIVRQGSGFAIVRKVMTPIRGRDLASLMPKHLTRC